MTWERAFDRAQRLLQRPVIPLSLLLAAAFAIELAQYVPELFAGAHALGEVTRNLAYALVGAIVFHWMIVERPAARRRATTYAFHRLTFQTLLTSGAGLMFAYMKVAELLGEDLDAWNKASLGRLATGIDEHFRQLRDATPDADFFGPARVGLLKTVVEVAVPRALNDLNASVPYMDVDVAHALSQFPRRDGAVNALHVRTDDRGRVEHQIDAHITWTLVQAARGLYASLLRTGAYDADIFEAWAAGGPGDPVRVPHEIIHRSEERK